MRSSSRPRRAVVIAASLVFPAIASAEAFFADAVVSYLPGNVPAVYQTAAAALGKPAADTGFGMLTPFNSAFDGGHIAGIGPGGSLTLRLSKTAAAEGLSLGIHTAVGIIDEDWPNGYAGPAATPFTYARSANLSVSQDGVTWVDLGSRSFTSPTNYYSAGVTAPGYQTSSGTTEADWSRPFTAPISAFNGKDWAGSLAVLDGSAGGDWATLSIPQLAGINYVRFTVPASATDTMHVDAVVSNTDNISITGNYSYASDEQIPQAAGGTIVTNTGTFTITGDIAVLGPLPVPGTAMVNNGTVRKSAGSGSATIAAPFYNDNGAIDVQSGTITITGRLSTAASSTLTKNGPGTLCISAPQHHGQGATLAANAGLTIIETDAQGLSLNVAASVRAESTQHLQSLSLVPGATLDLRDNDLVVAAGSFSAVRDLVVAGYSGFPDATKTGIISTTGQVAGNTILAVLDNSLVGAADWPPGSGQTISPNAIIGKYTYFGDANLDGAVTSDDYAILDANLNTTPPTGIAWLSGDANLDGSVTSDDYAILDSTLGADLANPLSAVPEPSALFLAGAGLLCARRRRR